MRWIIKHGDILNQRADVLICSANVYLNLSGGVGGEILRRYGPAMQDALHGHLAQIGRRFVDRGEVVVVPACGTPYKAVVHAVAVDAFYGSSAAIVESTVRKALTAAAEAGAGSVALTALATGYGRLPLVEFARGIAPLMAMEFPPVREVILCLSRREQAEELAGMIHPAEGR